MGPWPKVESSEDELTGRTQVEFSISSSCKVARVISLVLPSAQKLRKLNVNCPCLPCVGFSRKLRTNLCYAKYRQKVEKERGMIY